MVPTDTRDCDTQYNIDNNLTTLWDMAVNTDRTNRPDIIVKDSVNSTRKVIDMTVPSDRNIALKEIEKKSKYKGPKLEIQRMWHMKTIVIPVVVGALGTVKKRMVDNIGRDPFNQNFRKFRSKSEWIG